MYTYNGIFSHKKKEWKILPLVTTCMDVEGTVLSEVSQRQITMWSLLYVELKKKKLQLGSYQGGGQAKYVNGVKRYKLLVIK